MSGALLDELGDVLGGDVAGIAKDAARSAPPPVDGHGEIAPQVRIAEGAAGGDEDLGERLSAALAGLRGEICGAWICGALKRLGELAAPEHHHRPVADQRGVVLRPEESVPEPHNRSHGPDGQERQARSNS
ncbi:MAG: hypothetical protein R3B70_42865 [Polyangiaceae bacterium]